MLDVFCVLLSMKFGASVEDEVMFGVSCLPSRDKDLWV